MKHDRILQICNLTIATNRKNPNQNRVYSASGIAPCLGTFQGGNRQPIVPIVYETD